MIDKKIKPTFSDNDNFEYKKLKNEYKQTVFEVFEYFPRTKTCFPKKITSRMHEKPATANDMTENRITFEIILFTIKVNNET